MRQCLKDVALATRTDTTYNVAGYLAVEANGTGTVNNNLKYDDFGGGTVAGGVTRGGKGLYARLLKPLAVPVPTGQIWKVYYYASAQMIAMREMTRTASTLYYLHSDHSGFTGSRLGGALVPLASRPTRPLDAQALLDANRPGLADGVGSQNTFPA